MKNFLFALFSAAFCASSAWGIADDEPSAAREILRGANEARGVSAATLQDYVTQIAVIDKVMTGYDLNTRAFALGLYYEAWCHIREVKGMEADATCFYNQFRSIQFVLGLSDRQLAKIAHHHDREFAYASRR